MNGEMSIVETPNETSREQKLTRVDKLVENGWRVGAACKEAGLSYFTYNNHRGRTKKKPKKEVTHQTFKISSGVDVARVRLFMSLIEDELKKGE